MHRLTLAAILEGLGGAAPQAPEMIVADAVLDSREASPGALFVALPGEQTDGHEYVADAFHHGAILALVERDVAEDLTVVDLREGPPKEIPEPPSCPPVRNALTAL